MKLTKAIFIAAATAEIISGIFSFYLRECSQNDWLTIGINQMLLGFSFIVFIFYDTVIDSYKKMFETIVEITIKSGDQ